MKYLFLFSLLVSSFSVHAVNGLNLDQFMKCPKDYKLIFDKEKQVMTCKSNKKINGKYVLTLPEIKKP